jgi:hypothetical protein
MVPLIGLRLPAPPRDIAQADLAPNIKFWILPKRGSADYQQTRARGRGARKPCRAGQGSALRWRDCWTGACHTEALLRGCQELAPALVSAEGGLAA